MARAQKDYRDEIYYQDIKFILYGDPINRGVIIKTANCKIELPFYLYEVKLKTSYGQFIGKSNYFGFNPGRKKYFMKSLYQEDVYDAFFNYIFGEMVDLAHIKE